MKNVVRKLISAALLPVIAAAVALAACSCGGGGDSAVTTAGEDTPPEYITLDAGVTVVRSYDGGLTAIETMQDIRRGIETLSGAEPAISNDEEDRSEGLEIIIGATKREESVSAAADTDAGKYLFRVTRDGENKPRSIVIYAADDITLRCAVRRFAADYLAYDTETDKPTGGTPMSIPYDFADVFGERETYIAAGTGVTDAVPRAADESPAALTLYVDSAAGAGGDGSGDAPFATVAEAASSLRARIAGGTLPQGRTDIIIKSGEYRFDEPLLLTAADSAPSGCTVRYTAEGDVVFTGGVKIGADKFSPLDGAESIYSLLPEASRADVVKIDLAPYGVTAEQAAAFPDYSVGGISGTGFGYELNDTAGSYFSLYCGDERMIPARWPDSGEMLTLDGSTVDADGAVTVPLSEEASRHIGSWKSKNAWVFGYFDYYWRYRYVPLASYDAAGNTLTIRHGSDIETNDGVLHEGMSIYLYNLPEELTVPGEYYIDGTTLYLLPTAAFEKDGVRLPLLGECMVKLDGCCGTEFCGITFENTRSSAVSASGDHLTFEGCTFRYIGSTALAAVGYDIVVRDSEFYTVGKHAVCIGGGDRTTLASSGNFVYNCVMHDWGQLKRTYASAVDIAGVGVTVSHNTMYSAPHMAIGFLGNDQVIEHNEIYSVCTFASDSGAIYSGRRYDDYGTVIRANYIHDIGSEGKECNGIYLDDCLSGIALRDNVIDGVIGKGLHLGGGRDLYVEGNLLVDVTTHIIQYDARGYRWGGTFFVNAIEKLKKMPYNTGAWAEKYPTLSEVVIKTTVEEKDNKAMIIILPGCSIVRANPCVVREGGTAPSYNIDDLAYECSSVAAPEAAAAEKGESAAEIAARILPSAVEVIETAGARK